MRSMLFMLTALIGVTTQCFSIELYSIKPSYHWTSTDFEINYNGQHCYQSVKNTLGLRTSYTLTNQWGHQWFAEVSLMSWGSLKNSYREITVKQIDTAAPIGIIKGVKAYDCTAKYKIIAFPEGNEYHYANAIVDLKSGLAQFIVHDAPNQLAALFRAATDGKGGLIWEYQKLNPWTNEVLLQIFASFLADAYPPNVAAEEGWSEIIEAGWDKEFN